MVGIVYNQGKQQLLLMFPTNPTLCYPTDAHNFKKHRVIERVFKNKEAAPTCFCLQGNHHQGAAVST